MTKAEEKLRERVRALREQVRVLREKLAEMRELRDYASRDAKAARKERDVLVARKARGASGLLRGDQRVRDPGWLRRRRAARARRA